MTKYACSRAGAPAAGVGGIGAVEAGRAPTHSLPTLERPRSQEAVGVGNDGWIRVRLCQSDDSGGRTPLPEAVSTGLAGSLGGRSSKGTVSPGERLGEGDCCQLSVLPIPFPRIQYAPQNIMRGVTQFRASIPPYGTTYTTA